MAPVAISVPDGNEDAVSVTIVHITQDEIVLGPDLTSPDADGVGTSLARVRAERNDGGDGRVYRISFRASDGSASCSGTVRVGAPATKGGTAIDSVLVYDSTSS